MELEIVNFEQAKALKELCYPQFDEYRNHTAYFTGNHSYMRDDACQLSQMDKELIFPCDWDDRYNYEFHDYCGEFINAPTLELAAKWLREEKDIDVLVGRYMDSKTYLYGIIASISKYGIIEDNNIEYSSYEEALSAGIDKAIEILTKEK